MHRGSFASLTMTAQGCHSERRPVQFPVGAKNLMGSGQNAGEMGEEGMTTF